MIKKLSRVEYGQLALLDQDVQKSPFDQLKRWWQDALAADVRLLDAVHLSTVDQNRYPDARIVLLKSFDERGLVFYTNYDSPKAKQLKNNPHACLIIFWPKLERQIRVRGDVEKTTKEESEEYFSSRPRGAQIGAWASPQSTAIADRKDLEQAFADLSTRFSGSGVPCPANWGGFRLVPNYFEFWQGRENRLHDRFSFERSKPNTWTFQRLAP